MIVLRDDMGAHFALPGKGEETRTQTSTVAKSVADHIMQMLIISISNLTSGGSCAKMTPCSHADGMGTTTLFAMIEVRRARRTRRHHRHHPCASEMRRRRHPP